MVGHILVKSHLSGHYSNIMPLFLMPASKVSLLRTGIRWGQPKEYKIIFLSQIQLINNLNSLYNLILSAV